MTGGKGVMIAVHYISAEIRVVRDITTVLIEDEAIVAYQPISFGGIEGKRSGGLKGLNDRLENVIVIRQGNNLLRFLMFPSVYPYFLCLSPYLTLIVLSLLSFILYLLYSTTRTLFHLCSFLCSLYGLPFVSLSCSIFTSP